MISPSQGINIDRLEPTAPIALRVVAVRSASELSLGPSSRYDQPEVPHFGYRTETPASALRTVVDMTGGELHVVVATPTELLSSSTSTGPPRVARADGEPRNPIGTWVGGGASSGRPHSDLDPRRPLSLSLL